MKPTRTSSKRGSHATYGGWEPRTCHICHQPIVLTGTHDLHFHHDDLTGETHSAHVKCEHTRTISDQGGHTMTTTDQPDTEPTEPQPEPTEPAEPDTGNGGDDEEGEE